MPWIIGIDEAGYGPNLGPLVMTSVACRVPQELAAASLWGVLKKAVRRHAAENDRRLFIDDSKAVYSPARGLADLETGVLATSFRRPVDDSTPLSDFLDCVCPPHRDELGNEPWYSGTSKLPLSGNPADVANAASRFKEVSGQRRIEWGLVRSVVICPNRFNDLLDQWGTKGAVLGEALAELLRCNCSSPGTSERADFFVDKHGGRNFYAAQLQHALPDGFVAVEKEGAERSIYRVLGLRTETRLTFQPRADAEHFCVALASMVSKYVREALMAEFNRFWLEQVPGLKPTAGYPGDSERFFEAIEPTMQRLGICKSRIWRER
jgi:ribonuclease HII